MFETRSHVAKAGPELLGAEYAGRWRGWEEEELCSSLISLGLGWEALVIWVLPLSKAVLPTVLHSSRNSLSPAEDGAQSRVCSSTLL